MLSTHSRCVFALIGFAILGGLSCTEEYPSHMSSNDPSLAAPHVVAHRGLHKNKASLENSLEAVQAAIDLGMDIEIDVRQTKDSVIILHHDRKLKINGKKVSKKDGGGEIEHLSYTDLEPYSLATLDEVLMRLKGKSTLFLEIKEGERYPGIEKRIVELIEKYQLRDQVIVISFEYETLQKIKSHSPQQRVFQLLFANWIIGLSEKKIDRYPLADGLIVYFRGLTINRIERVRARDLLVYAWTPNKTNHLKKLIDLGIDGIITDNPEEAMKLVANTKYR